MPSFAVATADKRGDNTISGEYFGQYLGRAGRAWLKYEVQGNPGSSMSLQFCANLFVGMRPVCAKPLYLGL